MTMRIDNASWGKMNYARHCLSEAKWRKEVRAKHIEKIRLASEHMRSLLYWFKVARIEKTLKARKASLKDGLAQAHMVASRDAAIYCCQVQLVGDSCQSNIRNAISWTETALTAPTFKDWDCCLVNAESSIADALVQLDVALSKFKSLWKQAKADAISARVVIATCAKDILHPVALPKAVRKEMVRVYCAKRQVMVVAKGYKNSDLYHYAINTNKNQYNNISASACISQRRIDSLYISTKLWLRLVRNTRYTALLRERMFNNRQDYLVRLPVETSKVIRLR